MLAGFKAGPAVALPCSNEYNRLRPVALPSSKTPGLAHVKSVENAVLFLTFVAMSGQVIEVVRKPGNLFAGTATVPASATVLIGKCSSVLV